MMSQRAAPVLTVFVSDAGESFRAASPQILFAETMATHPIHSSYDIHPDGKRFVMIGLAGDELPETIETTQINLILNWFDEVRRLVPSR